MDIEKIRDTKNSKEMLAWRLSCCRAAAGGDVSFWPRKANLHVLLTILCNGSRRRRRLSSGWLLSSDPCRVLDVQSNLLRFVFRSPAGPRRRARLHRKLWHLRKGGHRRWNTGYYWRTNSERSTSAHTGFVRRSS